MSVFSTLLALALSDTNIAIIFAVFILVFLFFICNLISAPFAAGKSVFNLLTSSIVIIIIAGIVVLYVADKVEKNQIGDIFESAYYWYNYMVETLFGCIEYIILYPFSN